MSFSLSIASPDIIVGIAQKVRSFVSEAYDVSITHQFRIIFGLMDTDRVAEYLYGRLGG
jgi:hypothetical protein